MMGRRHGSLSAIVVLSCTLSPVTASLARAEARKSASLVKGPYLTGLTTSGVGVRFELDAAAPADVEVAPEGLDAGAARRFDEGGASTMHVVHLNGLSPATSYAYVVRVAGKPLARASFTTAPPPESGAPVTFLVYGDTRTDVTAHAAIVRELAARPSAFLVNTGDLVEDGGRASDWQSFFDVEGKLLQERALFVSIGNHELYDDRAGANFARYFGYDDTQGGTQPYGTARFGNVRFFFINSMHDWRSSPDRAWLQRELVGADEEPGLVWRIAVMHQGPWSSGPHGASAAILDAHVPELLASHGVDLVLSGHDHIYERGVVGRVKYVISGGGGAPLYKASRIASTRRVESVYHFVEMVADGDEFRLVAHRVDGSIMDRCGFKKGGEWDCDPPPAVEEAKLAGPSSPPSPAASRCGCSVPGAATGPTVSALVSVAAAALGWRRRRRRRG